MVKVDIESIVVKIRTKWTVVRNSITFASKKLFRWVSERQTAGCLLHEVKHRNEARMLHKMYDDGGVC